MISSSSSSSSSAQPVGGPASYAQLKSQVEAALKEGSRLLEEERLLCEGETMSDIYLKGVSGLREVIDDFQKLEEIEIKRLKIAEKREQIEDKLPLKCMIARFTAATKLFPASNGLEELRDLIQKNSEAVRQEILEFSKKEFFWFLSQKNICFRSVEGKEQVEKNIHAFFEQYSIGAVEALRRGVDSKDVDNIFGIFKKMMEYEISYMDEYKKNVASIIFIEVSSAGKKQANQFVVAMTEKLKVNKALMRAIKNVADITEARFKERIEAMKNDLPTPPQIIKEELVNQKSAKLSKKEKQKEKEKKAQELDELVALIDSDSKGKRAAKKKPPQKSKQEKKPQQASTTVSQPKKAPLRVPQSKQPDVVVATPVQKSAQLCERLFSGHPLRVHERVFKRWITRDIGTLRKALPGYSKKNDAQLLFERAKHYLPGLDRLAVNSLARQVYGFVTEGDGIGFFCRLEYNGEKHYGPVECGIDGDVLFHCYLSVKTAEQIAQMGLRNLLEAHSEDSGEDSLAAPWESTARYTKEVSEGGNLTMTYYSKAKKGVETHRLTLYPIRDEHLVSL